MPGDQGISLQRELGRNVAMRASENLRIGIHIDIHFDFQPWQAKLSCAKSALSVVQLFYMLTKNAKKNWKVQNWVHICGVRYLSYNSTKIVYNTFWVFGTLLISVETLLEQTSWLARLLWHSSQAALIRGYSRAFLPLPFALPFGSSAFPLPLPFLAWIPHQSSKNHCLRSNLDFWSNKKRTSTKSFFNILYHE